MNIGNNISFTGKIQINTQKPKRLTEEIETIKKDNNIPDNSLVVLPDGETSLACFGDDAFLAITIAGLKNNGRLDGQSMRNFIKSGDKTVRLTERNSRS